MKSFRLRTIALLLFILLAWKTAVYAQPPITFTDEYTENSFPDGLTFNVTATAVEGNIVSAKLYYAVRNAVSTSQQRITVEPANQVELRYEWDTSDITMPPSTAVFYHWEVVDSVGNRIKSEEQIVYYDDIRYEWQIVEDENIAVWQHDRPKQLGESVFAIAQRAIAQQKDVFQTDLEYQMRIIIYNDFDEFAGWHAHVNEFIGGQAFPALGITAQIVGENGSTDRWLNDVIPHEISHLYFYQVSGHPLSQPPTWLNEGVAQYNEFTSNQYALDAVRELAGTGDLVRLYALTGNFGNDEDQVRLSYAESVSAVTYLIETYGAEGLKNLLDAYKDGKSNDEALMVGLGVTIVQFEQGWLEWLGAPKGLYPTPTAVPTHAPVPTAAMMMPPTRKPTAAATVQATETPIAATPTPTAQATETAVSPTATSIPQNSSNSICATAALPLFAIGLIWKRKTG